MRTWNRGRDIDWHRTIKGINRTCGNGPGSRRLPSTTKVTAGSSTWISNLFGDSLNPPDQDWFTVMPNAGFSDRNGWYSALAWLTVCHSKPTTPWRVPSEHSDDCVPFYASQRRRNTDFRVFTLPLREVSPLKIQWGKLSEYKVWQGVNGLLVPDQVWSYNEQRITFDGDSSEQKKTSNDFEN